jgi:hypothetical protein
MSSTGDVIDRYVIEAVLGEGGMGRVYRAFDPRLGRRVALKVLLPRGDDEKGREDAAARMVREARAAAAFNHPNVVAIYDVGETGGSPYIAMELVTGSSLRSYVGDPAVSLSQKLAWLLDVARGLGAAHRSGLVHRDIKPDNVMITPDGVVKILDFGIARRAGATAGPAQGDLATLPALTAGGVILGTLQYMSPEQLESDPVDGRADQFSWAVMAWELLSGGLPWIGWKSLPALAATILTAPARPLKEAVPAIEVRVSDAIDRALSKKRDARFPAMEDLIAAVLGERPVTAPAGASGLAFEPTAAMPSGPGASSGRRRTTLALPRRRAALAWGGVLLALGLGGAAALVQRAHAPPSSSATHVAAAPFVSPASVLACPILEVRGVPDVAVAIGAANATSLCTRAKWFLGGRDERVLVPAQLLGLPTQPIGALPDPYATPEARTRTLESARARGDAYLDGVVTREGEGWSAALALRGKDGTEIARGEGLRQSDAPRALARALDALWTGPLLPREPIDPEVARWNGLADAEVGLLSSDLLEFSTPREACARIGERGAKVGASYPGLAAMCELQGLSTPVDAGAASIDESSGAALVTSLYALAGRVISAAEEERLAAKLEAMHDSEPTRLGRAMLAIYAATLHQKRGDHDRAHADALLAVREDPLRLESWQQLSLIARGSSATDATFDLAAAWFACDAMFHTKALTYGSDRLEDRVRDARVAYLLEPASGTLMALGRVLAEAGRADEVRALAVAPVAGEQPTHRMQTWLYAQIDLHEAKLARALSSFEESGVEYAELLLVARVLGRAPAEAKAWAAHPERLQPAYFKYVMAVSAAPAALCMYVPAKGDALACLDRVTGEGASEWLPVGSEAFMTGARRYAVGDLRGAVDAWRPLVAGPSLELVRLLPTEAFEAVGEGDLAARLDARKMAFAYLGGVSEAAPREARRALARGDRATAKDLARRVVDAWSVADATVPAVADMQALLRQVDAPAR